MAYKVHEKKAGKMLLSKIWKALNVDQGVLDFVWKKFLKMFRQGRCINRDVFRTLIQWEYANWFREGKNWRWYFRERR